MNKVLHWNAILLEASRRDHSQGYANGQQPGPTATSRAMAIVHLAIHDAVAYVNKPGAAYLKKKYNITLQKPPGAKLDDVIDGAAVTALKAMYPKYADYFDDSLEATQAASFQFGEQIAISLLENRANDGSVGPVPAAAAAGYGAHLQDPYNISQGQLGAQWGAVQHFVGPRKSLDDFPGHGLPSFMANDHYAEDYREVRSLGSAARGDRTAEDTLIGVYWAYDGAHGIGVPPRLYNQIARRLASDLSMSQAAELFAQINVAMADAGIDAWHYKYLHNLWRPVIGIRHETAGEGDCFWAPLGAPQTNRLGARATTPPFPAYPSGHATFGAALFQSLRLRSEPGAVPIVVADVLAAAAGGAPVPGENFTFVSDELDGRALDSDGSVRTRHERVIPSFARAVYENAISRVYLGVHWRFDGLPREAADNIGGVPLGLAIGQQVHEYFNQFPSLNGAG
jgi:hypothetical protein